MLSLDAYGRFFEEFSEDGETDDSILLIGNYKSNLIINAIVLIKE